MMKIITKHAKLQKRSYGELRKYFNHKEWKKKVEKNVHHQYSKFCKVYAARISSSFRFQMKRRQGFMIGLIMNVQKPKRRETFHRAGTEVIVVGKVTKGIYRQRTSLVRKKGEINWKKKSRERSKLIL